MFENLSKAMKGNQNARKKVGLQAIGGAAGGALTGLAAKAISVGGVESAKAFRNAAANTAVAEGKAMENLVNAVRRSQRVAKVTAGNTSERAAKLLNKTTIVMRNATRDFNNARAMKPTAIANAKKAIKASRIAKKYTVPIAAGGALIGATLQK